MFSSHDYDRVAREMISKHSEGLILDCGAGFRNKYYENIINFEVESIQQLMLLASLPKITF